MTVIYSVLENFKRGGKGFSWAEWNALSAEEQAAAIAVQTDLDMERSALVAFYIMHPKETLDMLGGDEAVIRAALEGKLK